MVNVIYLPAMFIFHMDIKQLNKYAIYITIGIAACLTFLFIFLNFKILYTDVDSARYMLSALIQSEAAIISIVVTLSLVAVQLAASSYSVRVIDVFRKTPALWMLLTIYDIVIFLGLAVLRVIDLTDSYMCKSILLCQSNLKFSIASTYSLGVLAYVALAAYIWDIFTLLKPSALIGFLAADISKENILESIKGETVVGDDPLLPIIDIVYGALNKYDHGTLETGLSAIEERISIILEDKSFNVDKEIKISGYIFSHLAPVGKLALSMDDEFSITQVINTIQNIGNIAAENRHDEMTNRALIHLSNIGIDAAKRKLELPTIMAIKGIQKIVGTLIENEFDIPSAEAGTRGASYLKEIGMATIDNRLDDATRFVVSSLGLIGRNAAKIKTRKTVSNIITILRDMWLCMKNDGPEELTDKIQNSLTSLHRSIPPELEDEKKAALRAFLDIVDFNKMKPS